MKKYLLLLILLIPFSAYAWGYEVISGDLNTVGSVVKIADEEFYVIGKEDDTHVKLLAKYNLGTFEQTYKQSENNSITVKFSNTAYWWDDVNKVYLDGYPSTEKYPNELEAYVYNEKASIKEYVDNYVDYLGSTGVCVTGRLMKSNELIPLGCRTECYDCARTSYVCNDNEWFNLSSFWLGDALTYKDIYSTIQTGVKTLSKYSYGGSIYINGGIVNPSESNSSGIRPVVILDLNNTCPKDEPVKEEVKGKTEVKEITKNPDTGVDRHLFLVLIMMVILTIVYLRLYDVRMFKKY